MKKYEMIREIFTSCENSKMRDVFIEEIETDDVQTVVDKFLDSKTSYEKYVTQTGTQIFELTAESGMAQKLTFSEIAAK